MAKIENTEYEDLTGDELKRVRAKMDADTGRTSDENDGGDGDSIGYAERPEEVR